MTQIVANGGSRTSQNQYTGVNREITVDESNKELRLHDGATPGGVRIPNIDTNDAKYQVRSSELDGLNKFDVNDSGILVRLGSANYTLRKLVGEGGITVSHAVGLDGNPTISLDTTLPGDREFLEDVIVRGVMQVDGGINANVAGNVTGDLTGNSTGTHTGPLIGDVDVRGKTLRLNNGQVPLAAVAGLGDALGGLGLSIGMIMMWAGTIATIPAKWALCDGSNGTPDLRNRFVLGTATESAMHGTAGAATHTHISTAADSGVHQHEITVADAALTVDQIPAHRHGNGVQDNGAGFWVYGSRAIPAGTPPNSTPQGDTSQGTNQGYTSTEGNGQPHTHGASSANSGNHTHAMTVSEQNHMPPSYALAYIMKIS